jgi:hypothetical protein
MTVAPWRPCAAASRTALTRFAVVLFSRKGSTMNAMNKPLAVASLIVTLASPALAVQYDFLTVTGNGIAGNAASTTFTSNNANGFITVSHFFPQNVWGLQDNDNPAIFPSNFSNTFTGTGNVQGHLAQSMYNAQSVVTFDLTNYNLSNTTVFGMWNTTDEVTAPPPGPGGGGGPPVYQIQLLDINNVQVNPFTFNPVGQQDNQTQVQAHTQMLMNPSTGEITFGAVINNSGTHTDAMFWDGIPTGTQQIIVYGDLPALNTVGDGVGYYFAEAIPEPTSLTLLALPVIVLLTRRRQRC